MAYILFDQGKKIGEITDWVVSTREPIYKNVLGKTVLSIPSGNECTFVSPKPVNKKSRLTVIQDGKREYVLQVKTVKGSTFVSATISSEQNLSRK